MVRNYIAFATFLLAQANAFAVVSAPCPIQRAAAAGPNVWLLCERKDLLVSADDGKTWQSKQLPTDERLRAIAFPDVRRGFVAGDGGTLLSTVDGGGTWRAVALSSKENLTSVFFLGDLGWLGGWNGLILHSTDGGKTWAPQRSGVLQGIDSIYFADANHGWAVGWIGSILRTADGGQKWEVVKTNAASWSLSAVYFRDLNHGWAVGFNGQILHSKDGGVTWQQQPSASQAWLTSVVFDSLGRGWIAAESRMLLSQDGGETWKPMPLDGALVLNQLLVTRDSVWVIGQSGVLRQTGKDPVFSALQIATG